MSEGMTVLEQRIAQFEQLLQEMRDATREAHAAARDLKTERREIERLLSSGEIKKLVLERVESVLKAELDKIGPQVREQANKIYEKVGHEIDRLIDLSLGKEFSTRHGREDVRPQLAAKLRLWIREVLDKEGYRT